MITYGTNPGMGMAIEYNFPLFGRESIKVFFHFIKLLDYIGFKPGMKTWSTDRYVFIGSLPNGR